jgi:hypothetical protein
MEHQGLAFIALLFPAIAASLAGMEAHREHLRLEKRSANMAPQMEQLNKQMASLGGHLKTGQSGSPQNRPVERV